MSINLTPTISNSNTFSEWVAKTNALITFADTAVTIDANNTGNVSLTGNFSLVNTGNVLTTNNISPVSGGKVTFTGEIENTDTLTVNSASEAKLQFKESGTNTWSVATSASQTAFVIGDGTRTFTIAASGITTSSGLKISNDMLPANVSLTGTLTSNQTATFGTVDINGGAIDGTAIGANTASTGAFTSVDINGGNIDGTTIGASVKAAGSFTTITGTGNATIGGTLGVTGTITGNVTGTATVTNSLNTTALTQVLNAVYPVGSLYYTTSNSTPNALNLPGNWARFAEGRSVVGYDEGMAISSASASAGITTLNFSGSGHGFSVGDRVALTGFGAGGNGNFLVTVSTANQIKISRASSVVSGGSSRKVALHSATSVPSTSGSNHITQTISQMPSHQHDTNIRTEGTGALFGNENYNVPSGDCLDHLNKNTNNSTRTSNTGSGSAMSILNRSAVVYIWERLAD